MNEFFIETVAAYNENKPEQDGSLVILNCPPSILDEFKKLLRGTRILGATYFNPYKEKNEKIPEDVNELTSHHLQILARNEHANVSGNMNTRLYNGLLTEDQIGRLRCLLKATTVSGSVYATHTGGYRHARNEFDKPKQNILIDQSGLQWQNDFRNTGGMHFYPSNPQHKSLPAGYQAWQTDMYKAMYGFERPSQCSANGLKVTWRGVEGMLDLESVTNAIAVEFSQALEAVVYQADLDLNDKARVNFKFCRAGMGFFISGLRCDVEKVRIARLKGIELVLQQIAELPKKERAEKLGKIGRMVLPHSDEPPYSDAILSNIGKLVKTLGLEWGGAPEEDSFLPVKGYVNATTNCGDPHAMPGNEGGPCSVDACIAYNANINNHIATYNSNMQLRSAPEFVFMPAKRSSSSHEIKSSVSLTFMFPKNRHRTDQSDSDDADHTPNGPE